MTTYGEALDGFSGAVKTMTTPSVISITIIFVGSISDACPSPEVIRENIRLALHKMILDPFLTGALVQFWAPTKTSGGRTILTTQHQPFALGDTYDRDDRQRVSGYRMEMCREYNDCFYADAESGEEQLGVPGRVFLHKFPEFNLDVKYCSLKECPQRDLALRCGIIGYLALPVFERSSQTCVGVLEISMLIPLLALYGYQKDFFRHVFDGFQEFGLQCFYGCKDREMRDEDEDKDEDKTKAFKELEMVLKSVRTIHKLLLAITWVPCSTCDHLFQGQHLFHSKDYLSVDDLGLTKCKEMLKTCHLRKGQVTGRILTFPKLSYCSDVKQFSISEYPLVACVRRLELSGCFTMCLQSSLTGSELYVLEFFLPPISQYNKSILTRLSSILRTVEKKSETSKLACSQEVGGGFAIEVIDFPNGRKSHSFQMIEASRAKKKIEATRVFPALVPLVEDGGGMLQLSQPDQPSMDKRNILEVTSSEESKRKTQKIEHRKIGVRIEVSLEDIIKCSKMSRADAARKLEVSISTLKRRCRDYGINQWPPRNMKEVHSSRPLPLENQEQTPQLSSDSSNEVSASVERIKLACQDEDLVKIRAKYKDRTIQFQLSFLSTLVELHQEVAKRAKSLNLEADSYNVTYNDDEDGSILIACDDDLQRCVRYFRSAGKTPIVVQLVPIQTS